MLSEKQKEELESDAREIRQSKFIDEMLNFTSQTPPAQRHVMMIMDNSGSMSEISTDGLVRMVRIAHPSKEDEEDRILHRMEELRKEEEERIRLATKIEDLVETATKYGNGMAFEAKMDALQDEETSWFEIREKVMKAVVGHALKTDDGFLTGFSASVCADLCRTAFENGGKRTLKKMLDSVRKNGCILDERWESFDDFILSEFAYGYSSDKRTKALLDLVSPSETGFRRAFAYSVLGESPSLPLLEERMGDLRFQGEMAEKVLQKLDKPSQVSVLLKRTDGFEGVDGTEVLRRFIKKDDAEIVESLLSLGLRPSEESVPFFVRLVACSGNEDIMSSVVRCGIDVSSLLSEEVASNVAELSSPENMCRMRSCMETVLLSGKSSPDRKSKSSL